jgi:CRP/FNR family cyclic AMP-dependent transcriptional regulator
MNTPDDALHDLAVFDGLTEGEIRRIAALCFVESFKKGSCIIEDQTPGSDLYVVMSGKVDIQLESITPQCDVTISTVGPRQIFGELALIDSDLRSAKATCVEDTDLMIISGEKLKRLFDENHRIGYVVMTNIAKTMCSRIRQTNRKLLNAMRIRLF